MKPIVRPLRDNIYYLTLFFLTILHLSSLFSPIPEGDVSFYACISKTMHLTGNYIELFAYGNDWLDKPHLSFWITALSFKVFGLNDFAYRFPALLFTVLTAFYTYKFARALYNRQVARLAVLSLLAAFQLVINNNHVKVEPYLTGFIIASVYYLYKVQLNLNWKNLLLGAFFAACAVMTKGVFVLIFPIGAAIVGELVIKGQWKELFHYKWLLIFILILIFITPELYALYYQFDSHPEKTIFRETGVSGIKFFFWDSQIGRFFNTGPITVEQNTNYIFFLHTLIWAFFPWGILLYYAFCKVLLKRSINSAYKRQEFYNFSAALFTTLIFSLSSIQYPHYIGIAFPFYGILIAQEIFKLSTSKEILFFRITQYISIAAGLGLILLIHFSYNDYQTHFYPLVFSIISLGLIGLIIVVTKQNLPVNIKIFYQSCLASIIIMLYFNFVFQSDVVKKYESGHLAASYANENFPNTQTSALRAYGARSFFFKSHQEATYYSNLEELLNHQENKEFLIYTDEKGMDLVKNKGIPICRTKNFEYFRSAHLNFKFINRRTRKEALENRFLVLINTNGCQKDY
ncbi:ArnT family glycosyltransferase [Xanthovirga aplysinae]|uniref:ArnT family glycosyltransferase n=1 Tax=Xanthovirga aplysinae TaxID=2529853 RepID=UPI0012BB5FF2|nr:glycosyltransferase family 39 protein [Xanthovirga aplysinae]MTI30090.1 phospholipid carrier-dependent glycosyltransferase [Xanthovirga aplysinae]